VYANNGGAEVQNGALEGLLTVSRRFAAHFDERQDPGPDLRIRINVMRIRNPGSDRTVPYNALGINFNKRIREKCPYMAPGFQKISVRYRNFTASQFHYP
jgi:hypothetical protein